MLEIKLHYLSTVEILPHVSTCFITNFSFSAKTNLKSHSNSKAQKKYQIKVCASIQTKCIAIPLTVEL